MYSDPIPAHLLSFRGYTWEDMPGYDKEDQKLSFALFRFGKYDPDMDGNLPDRLERRNQRRLEKLKKVEALTAKHKAGSIQHWLKSRPERLDRQKKLKARYDALPKERGWISRFRVMSGLTSFKLQRKFDRGEIPVSHEILDQIEETIVFFEKANQ